MNKDHLARLLSRPIAFHRIFADVCGSATAGLFLSQLYYWSDRGEDPDGWIYKTQRDWQAETMLVRYEQEMARKKLRDLGILEEEKRGVPCKLYYRLNLDRLYELILTPPDFRIKE